MKEQKKEKKAKEDKTAMAQQSISPQRDRRPMASTFDTRMWFTTGTSDLKNFHHQPTAVPIDSLSLTTREDFLLRLSSIPWIKLMYRPVLVQFGEEKCLFIWSVSVLARRVERQVELLLVRISRNQQSTRAAAAAVCRWWLCDEAFFLLSKDGRHRGPDSFYLLLLPRPYECIIII